MSKSQDKIAIRKAEQEDFLRGKVRKDIEERWEQAQLKAATMESVLAYMIEQYESLKEELPEDIITQTEEQIKLRRSEIEEYVMTEQDICLKAMEEYNKNQPPVL